MYFLKNSIQFLFFLSFCLVNINSTFGSPADFSEISGYMKFYNEQRGTFIRDHELANKKLKEYFEKIVNEKFGGNLSKFYLETSGGFSEYIEMRGRIKLVEDFLITSTSRKCLEVLNVLATEKAQLALEAMRLGQMESHDPIVSQLIQSVNEDVIKQYEIRGLKEAAQNALEKQGTETSSLPMKTASALVVGVSLYWFGPAYLMVGTQALFPSVWAYLFGVVPAVGTSAYYTLYLPAMMNTMGFVYSHSTAILCGAWVSCSAVAYGACCAFQSASQLAHSGMLKAFHYVSDSDLGSTSPVSDPELGFELVKDFELEVLGI